MRLSRNDLHKITYRKRPRHQAAWFREFLGAEVPCDAEGPILTLATYEALVAKRLGVGPVSTDDSPERRGVVRLRDVKSKIN
jgi:hypothetical protein